MALTDSELFSYISSAHISGRTTYFVASGDISGDSNLLREFSKHTSSTFLPFSELSNYSFKSSDLIVFVNIDSPNLFMSYLTQNPLPCEALLYTLYHPRSGIIDLFLYRKFKLSLSRSITSFLPLEYIYNFFKYLPYLYNLSPKKVLNHVIHPLDVIANQFSFLCCVSLREAETVATFTSLSTSSILLQPHLPLASTHVYNELSYDKPYFLTVGRAESRKNLLNLVNNIPLFPDYNFIVVSSCSSFEPSIIKKLRFSSSRYSNFILLEDRSVDQIYDLINNSFCVINASYFEVMSLIDVTAISLMVPVITSINSYIPRHPSVYFHYPADTSSLTLAIKNFLSK